MNHECLPTKIRLAWYLENRTALQGVYERFCAKLERPFLTPFQQSFEQLRANLAPKDLETLRQELEQEIGQKRSSLAIVD